MASNRNAVILQLLSLAIVCPPLDELQNGNIAYDPNTPPSFMLMTIANHTCNSGFELIGPPVRTCVVNPDVPNSPVGVWDQSPPVCQGMIVNNFLFIFYWTIFSPN